MNGALHMITDWEVNVVFLLSILFPLVTRFYWPWNESVWGWNIILLELSIAGCLLSSVLFIDFGIISHGLEWAGTLFLALVGIIIVWRAVIIWRTQRTGATEHQDRERRTRLARRAAEDQGEHF